MPYFFLWGGWRDWPKLAEVATLLCNLPALVFAGIRSSQKEWGRTDFEFLSEWTKHLRCSSAAREDLRDVKAWCSWLFHPSSSRWKCSCNWGLLGALFLCLVEITLLEITLALQQRTQPESGKPRKMISIHDVWRWCAFRIFVWSSTSTSALWWV